MKVEEEKVKVEQYKEEVQVEEVRLEEEEEKGALMGKCVPPRTCTRSWQRP